MANLTKCPNGHMYDADQTPQCPHCRVEAAPSFSSTAAADGFAAASSATGFAATGTAPLRNAGFSSAKTQAFVSDPAREAPAGNAHAAGGRSLRSTPTMPGFLLHKDAASARQTPEAPQPGRAPRQAGPEPTGPAPESGPFPFSQPSPAPGVFNPAVGWLVALTGPDKGRDFRLVVGKNLVGRDDEAHVRLSDAGQISRSHATVYYYPKVNEFYIEDHSSHGTYLNGKPIIQRTPVANMDRIEIGETTLLLRALCDSGFIWDEFK